MGKNFEVIFKEFADSETFVMSRGLLEDYKLKAAQEERERIIKLLEDAQLTDAELWDGTTIQVKCESVRADLLIALIKGENK